MEGGGSAVVTCTGCAMFVFLPQDRNDFVCTKCKLVSILEEKIEGLEQQITTLRCIRETEDFLDETQDRLLGAQSSTDIEQVAQRSQEASEEAWQHVTSRRGKRNVRVPVTQTQVTNRFHVLSTGIVAESGPDDMSGARKQKETPLVGRHEMRCPESHIVCSDPLKVILGSIIGAHVKKQEGVAIQGLDESRQSLRHITNLSPWQAADFSVFPVRAADR
ncbi:uncharacterized protein [Lepidochelys kempii]|uniref:uncharacterized protein n=1 Tax=Lepidochelys kempii TaxID=8472 RepID=UPI003C6FB419